MLCAGLYPNLARPVVTKAAQNSAISQMHETTLVPPAALVLLTSELVPTARTLCADWIALHVAPRHATILVRQRAAIETFLSFSSAS